MPAFLALLARPGRPPPYARCQPPCPYSPAPGRPPPTRGATSLLGPTRALLARAPGYRPPRERGGSLLGPTPTASQSKLLAYSPLLPPTGGGARAAPSAPSCPFSPGASRGSRHPAQARCRASWPYITPPMPEGEGPSRVLLLPLPFFTPPRCDPLKPTHSAYSQRTSRCRVGRPTRDVILSGPAA